MVDNLIRHWMVVVDIVRSLWIGRVERVLLDLVWLESVVVGLLFH